MLTPDPDQLALPFPLDTEALTAYVTAYFAIKDEEDRLRKEAKVLRENYKNLLPLRGLHAALKIEHTARTVAAHPTEGMPRPHVEALRAWVQHYLEQRAREVDQLIDEATGEIL